MDPLKQDIPQIYSKASKINVSSPLPFPIEVMKEILALVPVSTRISFAKGSHLALFLFYETIFKKDHIPAGFHQMEMSAVIKLIFNSPESINDEYLPRTPKGRKYLGELGIGYPAVLQRIKNGLPIVDAIANKGVNPKDCQDKFNALCKLQALLGLQVDLTLSERIQLGEQYLSKVYRFSNTDWREGSVPFCGALILYQLSQLDDPLANQAKLALDKWSGDSKNRVWLITQCAAEICEQRKTLREWPNGHSVWQLFEEQITISLQAIEADQSLDQAAVKRSVSQLVDLVGALKLLGFSQEWHAMEWCCSSFCKQLLDSPVIDEASKNAIRIYESVKSLADVPKLPPDIFFPYCCLKTRRQVYHLEFWEIISNKEDAARVKKTIPFLKRVVDNGCAQLNRELSWQSELVQNTFNQAGLYMKPNCSSYNRSLAYEHYECAEVMGHPGARLERFKILASIQNNVNVHFELGQLYLLEAKRLFTDYGNTSQEAKEMLSSAQDVLERVAEAYHIEAAILVAHHYSTATPKHQPKFEPKYTFKNADEKAMYFMELAIDYSLANAKATINENGIPNPKIIAALIDPAMSDIIFNLSEEYKSKVFQTDYKRRMTRYALAIAVELGSPHAIRTLNTQQKS